MTTPVLSRATDPPVGWVTAATDTVAPASSSLSLSSTAMVTAVDSLAVAVSAWANGGSFASVTVMVTLTDAVPLPSLTSTATT